ncbi:MAG: DsrE family protein, partial [Pseudomonadota bacterium]|nr:DsrE family protein [Pseudomonadota bacterium]
TGEKKINKNILIILFTSDFYKFYYALNLASTYQACDKKVTVYFTGFSCNFLRKDWEKYDAMNYSKSFTKTQMTSYKDVLSLCKELKVKFFFCKTAIDFLGINKKMILNSLEIEELSLYHIINKHKDNKTLFI